MDINSKKSKITIECTIYLMVFLILNSLTRYIFGLAGNTITGTDQRFCGVMACIGMIMVNLGAIIVFIKFVLLDKIIALYTWLMDR